MNWVIMFSDVVETMQLGRENDSKRIQEKVICVIKPRKVITIVYIKSSCLWPQGDWLIRGSKREYVKGECTVLSIGAYLNCSCHIMIKRKEMIVVTFKERDDCREQRVGIQLCHH